MLNIVYARIDEETKEDLDKQARAEHRNRSNMIGVMIKHYLEHEKTPLRRESVALRENKTDARKEVL